MGDVPQKLSNTEGQTCEVCQLHALIFFLISTMSLVIFNLSQNCNLNLQERVAIESYHKVEFVFLRGLNS